MQPGWCLAYCHYCSLAVVPTTSDLQICRLHSDHVPMSQVRNGQLDKEAGELRLENAMLSESADLSRIAAVNSEEVNMPMSNIRAAELCGHCLHDC